VDHGDCDLADCLDTAVVTRQRQAGCAATQVAPGDDRGAAASHDELKFMESPTPQPDPTKPATLNYGRAESMSLPWYRRLWAGIQERVDGIFEFLGLLIYFLGGGRRVALAFGLAYLGWGLGLCVQRDIFTDGPHCMWIGGFLVGLALPGPAKRNSK
jgi:hypothetical protein